MLRVLRFTQRSCGFRSCETDRCRRRLMASRGFDKSTAFIFSLNMSSRTCRLLGEGTTFPRNVGNRLPSGEVISQKNANNSVFVKTQYIRTQSYLDVTGKHEAQTSLMLIHTFRAVPLPCPCSVALRHICRDVPLPSSDSAGSFVKVGMYPEKSELPLVIPRAAVRRKRT
jgi:hypothetical protein